MKKELRDRVDLRLLILKKYGTISRFCDLNGIRKTIASRMLKGDSDMSLTTIDLFARLLGIPQEEYYHYFFEKKSHENMAME